ncbi:MAG: MbnH family di-heme enzyme [Sandaracinaceae bacterium]
MGDQPTWEWDLPVGWAPPEVPADNPMSEAKVELGRRLFYDPTLSADGTLSCSSCHEQARAFTDGRALSPGIDGSVGHRSAQPLANVGYLRPLTWANPLIGSLEEQALLPLFGESPVELGLAGREAQLEDRLRDDAAYVRAFAEAFPDDDAPVRWPRVLQALAAFQRTLVSGDSPYDRFLAGDRDALSDQAERGLSLFESERLGCVGCHSGPTLAGHGFHHTGLYDEDGSGSYPVPNRGVFEITFDDADMGRFRAASLRNVAVTAPYMHDGSIDTLDGVLDHYAAGGRAASARTSPRLTGFSLSDDERSALLAFLESLTDDRFLEDPRFSDPR